MKQASLGCGWVTWRSREEHDFRKNGGFKRKKKENLNSVHTTVLRIAVKRITSHEKFLHTAPIVALCQERGFWLLNMSSSAYLEVLRLFKTVLESSLSQRGIAQQRSLENSLLWSQLLQPGEWSAARVRQLFSLFCSQEWIQPKKYEVQ